MICFIAMFVFAILGIFSATHRKLAKEAFNCVFKKITLRKCDTGLDTRIRASITGALLNKSPKAAAFTNKHFELISWAFTLLLLWSVVSAGIGGYNYYLHGNCNGPNEDGFCIFDPTGSNSAITGAEDIGCTTPELLAGSLTLEGVNKSYFHTYNEGRENTVLFIGCYACEFSRKAYPTFKELRERDDVTYQFAHFPVKNTTIHLSAIVNCLYEINPVAATTFNDILFKAPTEVLTEETYLKNTLTKIGANDEEILLCAESEEMKAYTEQQYKEIVKTGIYGTPLVYINEEPVVGPKPKRVYTRLFT